MDSTAFNFSLHRIDVVAPSTDHTQPIATGSFPQQQTPFLAE